MKTSKIKIPRLLLAVLLGLVLPAFAVGVLSVGSVSADHPCVINERPVNNHEQCIEDRQVQICLNRGGVYNTSTGECENLPDVTSVQLDETTAGCRGATTLEENCIVRRMVDIINFLSVGVGMIAIGMTLWGGVEYITSDGNPEKAAKARSRIINAIVGIIAYIFLFGLLNFLIPGGLIG